LTQYQLGNYQDAEDSLEQATMLNSTQMTDDDRSKAFYTLGLSKVQNDDNQGASEAFAEAVVLNASNAVAWNDYGVVLNELDNHDEALKAFEEAIGISAENAEFHYNLGTTLNSLEKPEEAIASFDKAIEIEPSPRAYLAKGMALLILENYEEALGAFESAIALDDTKADLWAQKALTLYKLNRTDEALAAINKALSYDESWQYALDLKALIENPESGNTTELQSDAPALEMNESEESFENSN
jgi:tetratricopeptide (TPR) repeat protein